MERLLAALFGRQGAVPVAPGGHFLCEEKGWDLR
jgi:hypothetical protein